MEEALVLGKSTGTPTVSKGAVTIKMISSTSITSTMGVTLISATIWALRRVCLRGLLPREKDMSVTFLKLTGNNRSELTGERIQAIGVPVKLQRNFLVSND